MKDWSAIAKASGLDIPANDAAGAASALNGLEAIFRPLAQSLTPEMEPAVAFHADLLQTFGKQTGMRCGKTVIETAASPITSPSTSARRGGSATISMRQPVSFSIVGSLCSSPL